MQIASEGGIYCCGVNSQLVCAFTLSVDIEADVLRAGTVVRKHYSDVNPLACSYFSGPGYRAAVDLESELTVSVDPDMP